MILIHSSGWRGGANSAERIYAKVQISGPRQMRLWRGMLLTYPYPARRGYGVRGLLIGIYTVNTRLEWIQEDMRAALSDRSPCSTHQQAVSTGNL